MTEFPALEPNTRSYDIAGTLPILHERNWPHTSIRYSTGETKLTSTALKLQLTYLDLNQSQLNQIRAHYAQQQGSAFPFLLPAVVLQGQQFKLLPADTLWRYNSPPQEEHKRGGLTSITVSLESLNFEPDANVPGFDAAVAASITSTIGIQGTVTASFVTTAGIGKIVAIDIQSTGAGVGGTSLQATAVISGSPAITQIGTLSVDASITSTAGIGANVPVSLDSGVASIAVDIIAATGQNAINQPYLWNTATRARYMIWRYTSAELQSAIGAASATIVGINAFVSEAPSANRQPFPNYQIGMKNGTFAGNPGGTGYTIVKQASEESFTEGQSKTFLFNAPFEWDGNDLAIAAAWWPVPVGAESKGRGPTGAGITYHAGNNFSSYVINSFTPSATVSYRPVVGLLVAQ